MHNARAECHRFLEHFLGMRRKENIKLSHGSRCVYCTWDARLRKPEFNKHRLSNCINWHTKFEHSWQPQHTYYARAPDFVPLVSLLLLLLLWRSVSLSLFLSPHIWLRIYLFIWKIQHNIFTSCVCVCECVYIMGKILLFLRFCSRFA